MRGLLTGNFAALAGLNAQSIAAIGVVWIAVATLVFFVLSIYLMKRRLIK
jgi:hypothetical protein